MVVNKEIAKKLRDVGFNMPTDYFYTKKDKPVRRSEAHSGNKYYATTGMPECDAPKKGDVFAWFRGKGITGVVLPLPRNFYFVLYQSNDEAGFTSKNFPTWEQSEDACIEEMIKLIQ